jgi:CubicO group peptidase (beta-lactamase class C family)
MKIMHIPLLLCLVHILLSCHTYDKKCKTTINQNLTESKSPADLGFSAERLARLDSFLENAVKTGALPNAVTYIARHGKVVHYKAFGYRNIENKVTLEKDDIFRNASQTKTITSVGLMMLYEQGKFLLDDPISRYIPEFKDPVVLEKLNEKDTSYTTRPAKREITIRHLLSHTSGLSYGNLIYSKNKIPLVNSLADETIEQVVKRLAKLPLSHDPGEQFTYGLNVDVCGYLIELFSGMKLDEYFKTRIFEPLGMNDSYFYLPEVKEKRLVTLYEKVHRDSALQLTKIKQNQIYPYSGAKKYFSGGAGIVGPIEDYAKLLQMLLNKGEFNHHRLLSPKTIELMTTNQIGDLSVWTGGNKFGLGFELITERGGHAKYPSSMGEFKWGGMYCTDYFVDPKEDMVCLFYTNVQPFALYDEMCQKFRVLVYQALVE